MSRLRFGRSATAGFDYIATNDGPNGTPDSLATILALGGAALSGKRIGLYPITFTSPTFSFTGNSQTVTFESVLGTARIEQGTLSTNIDKVKFQSIRWTSAAWPGSTSPCCGFVNTIYEIEWNDCEFCGNYRGDVDYDLDAMAEYPEYASILVGSTTSAPSGGAITSLTLGNTYVGDLVPDGPLALVNYPYNGSGTGFTGTAAVVGGYLVGPLVVTNGGSGYAGQPISSPVTWAGQHRAAEYFAPAFQRRLPGAATFVGPFRILNCRFTMLLEACKGMTAINGVTIHNNTFDKIYSDKISLGTSSAVSPQPVTYTWNTVIRPLCVPSMDPGDPHGDGIQMFMDATTLTNWLVDVTGNTFTSAGGRGTMQPYFLTNPASPSVVYTGRITGNIGLNYQQSFGLNVSGTEDMYIYGNTILREDTADPRNVGAITLALHTDSSYVHAGNFVGGNITEGWLLGALKQGPNIDATSVQNAFIGVAGGELDPSGYDQVVANPNGGALTAAAIAADYLSIGTYAGMGASQSDGYVDFATQTIDRTKEPTVVNFQLVEGVATSSTQTSNWSCMQGGPDAITGTLAGTSPEWRTADDASGTNATAWASSPITATRRKFLQVRDTASGSAATGTRVTVTLNGHANYFDITTASVSSFTTVDNQATAYSTWASPANESSLAKFIWVWRGKIDAAITSRTWFGRGSTWNVDMSVNSGLNTMSFVCGTGVVAATTMFDTNTHTHMIVVDLTKTSIVDGGIQWWIDGQLQVLRSVTFKNVSAGIPGTRTLNLTAVLGNLQTLAMFARGTGTNIADARLDFFWMHWGTSALTLPDLSLPDNRAKWLADRIGADGSGPLGVQPKIYWTGSAAAWNAGLTNLGSLTLPLTKGAGTYV